jgi:thiol-disulfide isomerase/thioredoxin
MTILGFLSNKTTIIVSIFIIILIIISAYIYKKSTYNYNKYNDSGVDIGNGIMNYGEGGQPDVNKNIIDVYYFYTTWCPYSKTSMPIWDNISNKYNGTTIGIYTLEFIKIDCTNETPDVKQLIQEYNITGYPTIIVVKNGQTYTYDAKITDSNLDQFIKATTKD